MAVCRKKENVALQREFEYCKVLVHLYKFRAATEEVTELQGRDLLSVEFAAFLNKWQSTAASAWKGNDSGHRGFFCKKTAPQTAGSHVTPIFKTTMAGKHY